jgi:hypothetical protein
MSSSNRSINSWSLARTSEERARGNRSRLNPAQSQLARQIYSAARESGQRRELGHPGQRAISWSVITQAKTSPTRCAISANTKTPIEREQLHRFAFSDVRCTGVAPFGLPSASPTAFSSDKVLPISQAAVYRAFGSTRSVTLRFSANQRAWLAEGTNLRRLANQRGSPRPDAPRARHARSDRKSDKAFQTQDDYQWSPGFRRGQSSRAPACDADPPSLLRFLLAAVGVGLLAEMSADRLAGIDAWFAIGAAATATLAEVDPIGFYVGTSERGMLVR